MRPHPMSRPVRGDGTHFAQIPSTLTREGISMSSKSNPNDRENEVVKDRDSNPDPITGTPGSHPVGTGVGAAAGGSAATYAGAAIGAAAGGPVGAVVGGVVG